MSDDQPTTVELAADRRSSIRVRSQLPCSVRQLTEDEIPALEAQILDLAVVESDGVMHDAVDWRDHAEDLSRETVFLLNEVRALRQQITEMQRVIERYGETSVELRWIELNDQGFFLPTESQDRSWKIGEIASLRVQIPSLQTPEVLAVAEVIRIDEDEERPGAAFSFRSISTAHRNAISRYALRRERQLARTLRFRFD